MHLTIDCVISWPSMQGGCGPNEAVLFDAKAGCWVGFRKPVRIFSITCQEEVIPTLQRIESLVDEQQLFGAGFVSYEAAPAFDASLSVKPMADFPLLWFGVYARPECVPTFEFAPRRAEGLLPWADVIAPSDYRSAIGRIREYIQRGHTYQVNYSTRLRTPFMGNPWDYFGELIRAQQSDYLAFINTGQFAICSASPELFFRLDGDRITCRPMKGTAPRGRWLEEDQALAHRLLASEKNRSENVMIVDMVRNDLGRIAVPGSIQVSHLFTAEKYPTLWQLTSTITARTTAGLCEILRALFPCASITGAPKRRTMEIIAELEAAPRRIYTGTIGFVAPGRQAQFNVGIRTVLIDQSNHQAEYGVGGGILWESCEAEEREECQAKARVLRPIPPEWRLLETMAWTPTNGFFLLDHHLTRLRRSAEYFNFKVDLPAIRQALEDRAADWGTIGRKVRLLVSRLGAFTIQATEHSLAEPQRPRLRVRLAPTPVDGGDPFLFHKTTRRDVYEQMLSACAGYDDVLLWNQQGEVTEFCLGNAVMEIDGEHLTPPISCGLLAGTYRAWALERGAIKEKVILVRDLRRYTDMFRVNSVSQQQEVQMDVPSSSLLNLIDGLDRPTSGTLRVLGRDTSRFAPDEATIPPVVGAEYSVAPAPPRSDRGSPRSCGRTRGRPSG